MRFTAETRGCLKSKISPRLTGGRTTYVCTNEFLTQNQNLIEWMYT